MGYTADPSQRAEICAAIERMTWSTTQGGSGPPARVVLASPVVRVAAAALVRANGAGERSGHSDPLGRLTAVGAVTMSGRRRLVGLDDGTMRHYLLVCDYEVIEVASECRRGRTAPDAA